LQLLNDLELLLLFLIYFSIDFPQLFAKSSRTPIKVVMIIQVNLVFSKLFVGIQIGVEVTGDGLRNLFVVMELLMLLDAVLVDHAGVTLEVIAELVYVQLLRKRILVI
jgi:hypothetical protein